MLFTGILFVLQLFLLLGGVAGQLTGGSPGVSNSSLFNGSRLCDRTFADANATGIYYIEPNLNVGSKIDSTPVSWATTISQSANVSTNSSLTELSLWYSPNGANYSNNFGLGYDVCYLFLSSFTINTSERAQDDDGDCTTALDDACVNDITVLASEFSVQLVGEPSPQPNSNLSTNSLPIVCDDIARMMSSNFPKSCEVFMKEGQAAVFGRSPALGEALTGNQSLVERSICTMNDSYSLLWSEYGPATNEIYTFANYFITPLITTFMPIADAERTITLFGASSFMTCLRAKNITSGSQSVAHAPLPTPIDTSITSSNITSNSTSNSTESSSTPSTRSDSSTGLSGGAIAGIAVGVVLGVLILVGILIFLHFRKPIREAAAKRRDGRSRGGLVESGGGGYGELDSTAPTMEAPTQGMQEIYTSPQMHAELPAEKHIRAAELAGNGGREPRAINKQPVEMDGT